MAEGNIHSLILLLGEQGCRKGKFELCIEKIEIELRELIISSLKKYIYAWHKTPKGLDIENLEIKRIRYVMKWGKIDSPEDAFIIEFNSRKDVLSRSELGLSTEEFKSLIEKHNQEGILFAKTFISVQEWYEYPVVFGELDPTFDDAKCYEEGGMYEGNDYTTFKKRNDMIDF